MINVNDFSEPDYKDISFPGQGFFGYLLRCKCLSNENQSGNVIFLDDGKLCVERFPQVKKLREQRRKSWTTSVSLYQNYFIGQLFYICEEKYLEFIDFMSSASDAELQDFLEKFVDKAKSFPVTQRMLADKVEPLFAVSHVSQLVDKQHVSLPHIHILWGKRKKKRSR